MSYVEERQLIVSHFENNWGDQTPIIYENSNQEEPENEPYVKLTIINGEENQIELGLTRNHRSTSMVVVQIFVRANTGLNQINSFIDIVCAIFRGKTLDRIKFRSPITISRGTFEGWYQVNVQVPFKRDEIYNIT